MLDISTTAAAEESYPFVKRVNTCREHPSPKEFGLTAVRPCLSTAWLMAQTYNNNNNHLRLTASRPCTQHREARARAPPKKERETYNNNNNHLRLTASRPCMQHREARARAPPKKERDEQPSDAHASPTGERSITLLAAQLQTKGGNKGGEQSRRGTWHGRGLQFSNSKPIICQPRNANVTELLQMKRATRAPQFEKYLT